MHKNYLGITYFITKGNTNNISKIMKIELITSFSSLDLGMSHLNSFYNDYLSKVTDKMDANEFCPCGNS